MVGGSGVRVGGKTRLFVGGYVELLAHLSMFSLFPLLPRGQGFAYSSNFPRILWQKILQRKQHSIFGLLSNGPSSNPNRKYFK